MEKYDESSKEILESYFKCRYKTHLYFLGEKGIKSDYEKLLLESRAQIKQKANQIIISRCSKDEVAFNVVLSRQLLQREFRFIINGKVKDENLSLSFEYLKKMDGRSKIANCHYVPILISESENIHIDEKRLLALYGLILAYVQARHPREGIFIHGQQLKTSVLKLNPSDRKTRRVLEDIKDIQKGVNPPPLILNSHCQVCEFQQRCLQQATNDDNISLLRGMTEKQMIKFSHRGILTVAQLSHIYRARRKPSTKTAPRHDFALQALALREKRIYINELPPQAHVPVRIFLDIEGIPERHFDYLVGALICTPDSEIYHSFWADDPTQESTIFERFLDIVANFKEFHVFHYGAYDLNFIKRMRAKVGRNEIVDKILLNATNVLSLIYGRIYFPVYSNNLKEIARLLGYSWSDETASGINSIVWRFEWEKDKNSVSKKRLLTYNNNDCAALKTVTEFIFSIDTKSNHWAENTANTSNLPVSYTNDLRPTFSRPNWGTPKFATEDLDYVNRCSYFDYQRKKIYVRTNLNIAKLSFKNTRRPKRIQATRSVKFDCSVCPYCRCAVIVKCSERIWRRKCLDLEITENYVRRVVNENSSYKYRCVECGKEFFAEQYTKTFKYGHSLKSWAMYEYVAHRISLKSLEGTFRELFNLPVCFRHIVVIKRIMANYYRETIEGIRRRLMVGSILHADETQVHLQKGKGYVWAFTNLDEVLYVYTQSRDGSFLNGLFADFSGVLISDFYAVYDWPHCAQQKCLIHLIRDLNNELLRNPFDEEYKLLVTDFGHLLRGIIETVDKYGLIRRHLVKHQHEVRTFMTNLEKQCYRSVIAQSVQDRIIRNKGNLFTFLNYDGVPWNNNNAEHAIKRFAHYREITDGHVTENGLTDYLVLLSINQTCEFKGISFLKFLLSGEIDIGKYREKSGQNPQSANGEVSLLEQGFFDRNIRNKTLQETEEPGDPR